MLPLSMDLLFGVPALAGPGRLEPGRCSRKRGARPSRSLCSASRRTAGGADSTHRLVRPGARRRLVGGTPTRAVETTALPIFKCIVPAEGEGQGEGDLLGRTRKMEHIPETAHANEARSSNLLLLGLSLLSDDLGSGLNAAAKHSLPHVR